MLKQITKFFTSLKLTVTCLTFFLIIVFVGTMAQVDQGLYQVQELYFKSLLIYWGPENADWKIPVLPGGYLVGVFLMTNLVAAFVSRFKLTKKKFGIYVTHAGLILLLLGQVFTDALSRERAMEIEEGRTSSHSEDFKLDEWVLIDHSNPSEDKVYSIADSLIAGSKGSVIIADSIPFNVKVLDYWQNVSLTGSLIDEDGNQKSGYNRVEATTGFDNVYLKPIPPATSMDSRDMKAAIVELLDGDTSLGQWLVATRMNAQKFSHNGKQYSVAMRAKRYYKDFSLTLLRATHDKYTGTDLPKNFASRVRLKNDNTGEDREVLIYMNHPLRYEGMTFFQHQMTAGEVVRRSGMTPSSVFQVVKNPTWLTPYFACIMVGLGLLIQFMIHLLAFVKKRKQAA